MTTQFKQLVARFSRRIENKPELHDHWNEILQHIGAEEYADQYFEGIENERIQFLEGKLKKACKNVQVLKLWVEEGKLDSRLGFNRVCDYIAEDIKKGVVKL